MAGYEGKPRVCNRSSIYRAHTPPTHRHPPLTAGTETEDKVQKRLSAAVWEMDTAKGMTWDGWVVNDDVEAAYAQLRELTQDARQQRAQVLAKAAAAAAGGEAKK